MSTSLFEMIMYCFLAGVCFFTLAHIKPGMTPDDQGTFSFDINEELENSFECDSEPE